MKTSVTSFGLFIKHARKDPDLWKEVIGQSVVHNTWGKGVIIQASQNAMAIRIGQYVATISFDSLFDERDFSKITIPDALSRKLEHSDEHSRKKRMLLEKLKRYFEIDFLKAFDFYQSECSTHISPEEYESEKVSYARSWARRHLEFDPDPEQAAAMGAVECHLQVVARAGSGKTSTLVNRALFLQQHCNVSPHEMLLLAFNRRAADEMRERLLKHSNGRCPHVMTFHALAYALVHPKEAILVDEPDGEQSKSRATQAVIDDYLRTPHGYENMRTLMLAHFRQDWEQIWLGGYGRSREDMLKYRRSLPREGLDGKYYKSAGEKIIGDFLFEHNIKYKYERNFLWNGINYRPDFSIFTGENQGIIIEYFGLKGDPDYDAQSEQKRRYWQAKPGWTLLEFSNRDLGSLGADGFRAALQHALEEYEIACTRLSEDEIWHRIKDRAIDRFTRIVVGFVQRCRKLSLTLDQLAALVSGHDCTSRVEERFLDLVQVFYQSYLERLDATGEEDFDGLMQQAATLIAEGHTVFHRKSGHGNLRHMGYVFIDEYQDFSDLFHRLVTAIQAQNPQARFFCVGDDWQSINGFAGSDLRFYQRFHEFFHSSRQINVTTNYRSAKMIVDIGNALMYGRGKPARAKVGRSGTVLLADLATFQPTLRENEIYSDNILTPAVLRIVTKEISDGKNVVLLSRKNSLPGYIHYGDRRNTSGTPELDKYLNMIREHLPAGDRDRVTISTTHKYKGLEKHTVIVLDAVIRCYPLIHTDAIFTRVLGDTLDRTVDEERRLFYVALTRAVERLVVITENNNESPFVEEIRSRCVVPQLSWSDYPPIAGTAKRITVKVGNQAGRGKGPTVVIKDMLKAHGYSWNSVGWQCWYRTCPIDAFSAEKVIAEAMWSTHADGIEVRFCDDSENIQAAYYVNNGQWHRVV